MADEYEMGDGKPPKHSRFVKGHSGNPKGRPKGSKNVATIFRDVSRETIQVTENGRTRRIPKIQAMMIQIVNKAYPFEENRRKKGGRAKAIVELTVDYAVLDIADFTVRATNREFKNGKSAVKKVVFEAV